MDWLRLIWPVRIHPRPGHPRRWAGVCPPFPLRTWSGVWPACRPTRGGRMRSLTPSVHCSMKWQWCRHGCVCGWNLPPSPILWNCNSVRARNCSWFPWSCWTTSQMSFQCWPGVKCWQWTRCKCPRLRALSPLVRPHCCSTHPWTHRCLCSAVWL